MNKRGRGRPPKNPFLHALTKQRKISQDNSQSLSSFSNFHHSNMPARIHHRTVNSKGGLKHPREAAQRSRLFLAEVMSHTKPECNENRESDEEPHSLDFHNESDIESKCDFRGDSDNDSTYSESSYSTISSTPSRKRLCIGLQALPSSPLMMNQSNLPCLELPQTSNDLLLPLNHIMQAIGIYEVLRHFRHQLRLTPFRFEDFSASLLSCENCSLMAETHIALLKSLIREDDINNTTFGPQDVTHFVNIQLYLVDGITWPEVLRIYVESDPEFHYVLPIVEKGSYPYGCFEDKLKILQFLTDQFLSTTITREKFMSEGAITYDDHCRSCHRLGDLICCETCSAVYHLECINPPLNEVPLDDWICEVCRNNKVEGVTDCISEFEKTGLMVRNEPIGFDRHFRKYWFLVRRIIVENEDQIWYYSTELQIKELLKCLDDKHYELDLCRTLNDLMPELLHHSKINQVLTDRAKGNLKSVFDISNQKNLILGGEESIKSETRKIEKKEEPRSAELKDRINVSNYPTDDANICIKLKRKSFGLDAFADERIYNTNTNEYTKRENMDNKKHSSNPIDEHPSTSNNNPDTDPDDCILTRSKNPSYKPPPPKDSPYISYSTGPLTASLSKSQSIAKANTHESFFVMNEKGEHIPVFSHKSKEGFLTLNAESVKILQENNILFKLGMEGSFKHYKNQYSINNLALNKPQHSEDSNKRRHLSHKFSLGQENDFKWFGNLFGPESLIISNICSTLTELEKNIPDIFMHSNWKFHRVGWIKAVNMCSKPSEFALALAILESAIRPVVFNSIWNEGLGHWRLERLNPFQREEKKKTEKKKKEAEDDDLERQKLTCSWVKYSILNVRHTVWKSKGEEYRIYGGGGFSWISNSYKSCAKGKKNHSEDLNIDSFKICTKQLYLEKEKYDKEILIKNVNSTKQESLMKNDHENYEMNCNVESNESTQVHNKELIQIKNKKSDQDLHCNQNDNEEDSEPDEIDGVLNISKGIKRHTVYRKISRLSKLNSLLDRRLLQETRLIEDYEAKRKLYETYLSASQQLLDKKNQPPKSQYSGNEVEQNLPQSFSKSIEENTIAEENTIPELDKKIKVFTSEEAPEKQINKKLFLNIPFSSKYICYSPFCVQLGLNLKKKGYNCYSIFCRTHQNISRSTLDELNLINSPSPNISTTNSSLALLSLSKNITHNNPVHLSLVDNKNSKACLTYSVNSSTSSSTGLDELIKGKIINKYSTKTLPTTVEIKKSISSPLTSKYLINTGLNSPNLRIINTSKSILVSPDTSFVKSNQCQDKISIPKNPPLKKQTRDPIYLSKINSPKVIKKMSRPLPSCVKFSVQNGQKSIFNLQKKELKKIARKGGRFEVIGFNYIAKTTGAVSWVYQSTPRPRFKTVWRYKVQTLKSLSAVSLLLRILWVSVRWEDIAVKPPTGSNIEETADELITKEILKRRDTNGDGLCAEYLVRKIITPIDEEEEREELYIPQRKGLRSSTRTPKPKSIPKPKGPRILEDWVNEDHLELWEIRQFGERIEQQQEQAQQQNQQHPQQKHGILQHSMKDKNTISFSSLNLASTIPAGATVSANQSAQQIKEQLEMQLKLQRQAMQQKRLQSTTLSIPSNLQKPSSHSPTEANTVSLPLNLQSDVTKSSSSITITNVNTSKVSKGNPVSILPARTFPPYIIQSGKSVTTVPTGTNVITTKITLSPQILKSQTKPGNTTTISHQPVFLQAIRNPSIQPGTFHSHKGSPIQLQLRGPTPVQLRGHLVRNADGTQRVIITPAVITSTGIQQPISSQQESNKEVNRHQVSQHVTGGIQKLSTPTNIGVIKEDLDQERLLVCAKVLTNILDKIEKEDKQMLKKKKQLNIRLSSKLNSILIKHKENLKKIMIKKKELLEKALLQEIQEEVSREISINNSSVSSRRKRKIDSAMKNLLKTVNEGSSKPKKFKLSNKETSRVYCVCKKPYDPTKFYIGCELCNNWFHGSCVNILEENAKNLTEYVCTDCKSQKHNKDQDLYCICQTPYDESQFYIGCDNCQDWFHGKCVGISSLEAESIKNYLCPQCKTSQSDIYSKKDLNHQDFDQLLKILRQLQNHKMSWPFLKPVNENEAHDYYKIVKEPMDLSTVEKKIKMKNYTKLQQFIRDVTKIFDNCRYYNPSESSFYHCADVLEKYFVQKYKSHIWN